MERNRQGEGERGEAEFLKGAAATLIASEATIHYTQKFMFLFQSKERR